MDTRSRQAWQLGWAKPWCSATESLQERLREQWWGLERQESRAVRGKSAPGWDFNLSWVMLPVRSPEEVGRRRHMAAGREGCCGLCSAFSKHFFIYFV